MRDVFDVGVITELTQGSIINNWYVAITRAKYWTGNEYLQLYPSIEYYDGTVRYTDTKEIIPEGFYVKYYFKKNIIVPLWQWLNK